MQIHLVEASLMHVDRQTDVTAVIGAFGDCVNVLKM
jgi:hypothetical protein